MTTLSGAIGGFLPSTPAASRPQAPCWVTRWRDQRDLPSFQRNSHFTLALLHAHVHEAGKRALRLRGEGDRTGSRQATDEMERALVDALELIDQGGRGIPGGERLSTPANRVAELVIDRLRCGGQPLRPADQGDARK